MPNDILYECAKKYKYLENYEFNFILNKNCTSFTLKFEPNDFLHLTSIEKLFDLWEIKHTSSETVLNMILNHEFTYDRLTESEHFNELRYLSKVSDNVEYTIKDRLIALTNLYDYLHNISPENTEIYKWLRNVPQNERPNNSKINADFLMEFYDTSDKKTQNERVCSFFIDSKMDGTNTGVSIFPTDVSYSNDGKIKLSEYKILSATEICKSTGKITPLIQCTPEELRKAQEASLRKDQSITIKNDLKALKSKRSDYVSKPDAKTRTAYEKQLSIFRNRNIYTLEMLEIAADRLKAQLDDPHNSAVAETIKSEIEYIKNETEQRRKEPDNPTKKSISIVKNQLNADGTISSETAAEIPVPDVKKIQQKAQRDTHTVVGSINSFISDVKNLFGTLFKKPKKQAAPVKKSPSNKPKSGVKTANKNAPQKKKNSIEISMKVPEKSVQNAAEKPAQKPYFTSAKLLEISRQIKEEERKNPRPKKEKSHSHEIE